MNDMPVVPHALQRSDRPLDWRRQWLGGWAYWGCQFAGWLGNVIYDFGSASILGEPHPFQRIFPWAVICFFGLVVSHPLHGAILWLRARSVGWHLIGGVGVAVILAAVLGAALVRPVFAPLYVWFFHDAKSMPSMRFFSLFNEFIFVLSGWIAFYFAVTNYRDNRASLEERLRLETALKEAELRALRAQLNPHFLFNSLNLLRALIPRELQPPREAVTLLADVLRASLAVGEQELIPLTRELATVDSYLAIEQLRYGPRLRVERNIAPATSAWAVPPFLVQSLVENAVKFGIAPREAGGEIRLTTEIRGSALLISITNPGIIADGTESTGLGLKNARRRLAFLFGPAARLTLVQCEADLVAAEVLIPASVRPHADFGIARNPAEPVP